MHDKLLDKRSRLAERRHTGDAIRRSPKGGQGILEPTAGEANPTAVMETLEAVVAAAITAEVGSLR